MIFLYHVLGCLFRICGYISVLCFWTTSVSEDIDVYTVQYVEQKWGTECIYADKKKRRTKKKIKRRDVIEIVDFFFFKFIS